MNEPSLHLAKLRVSPKLLRQALHFPYGTEFMNFVPLFANFFPGGPELEITLTHPDLPAITEGEKIPLCCPIMQYQITELKDWNVIQEKDGD